MNYYYLGDEILHFGHLEAIKIALASGPLTVIANLQSLPAIQEVCKRWKLSVLCDHTSNIMVNYLATKVGGTIYFGIMTDSDNSSYQELILALRNIHPIDYQFIRIDSKYSVSSTFIRTLWQLGGNVLNFIPIEMCNLHFPTASIMLTGAVFSKLGEYLQYDLTFNSKVILEESKLDRKANLQSFISFTRGPHKQDGVGYLVKYPLAIKNRDVWITNNRVIILTDDIYSEESDSFKEDLKYLESINSKYLVLPSNSQSSTDTLLSRLERVFGIDVCTGKLV